MNLFDRPLSALLYDGILCIAGVIVVGILLIEVREDVKFTAGFIQDSGMYADRGRHYLKDYAWLEVRPDGVHHMTPTAIPTPDWEVFYASR